ncbi:hypothetical protein EYF80_015147 [Liparis tanakae]|uniref:Uncharacterized protein n=1 Tax=Liparis tanakae TaxID=230148 RepID=A0A4Z2I9P2_9TELE|nr:hypothetical protein EYF80_015147 [Liparis tanakae]
MPEPRNLSIQSPKCRFSNTIKDGRKHATHQSVDEYLGTFVALLERVDIRQLLQQVHHCYGNISEKDISVLMTEEAQKGVDGIQLHQQVVEGLILGITLSVESCSRCCFPVSGQLLGTKPLRLLPSSGVLISSRRSSLCSSIRLPDKRSNKPTYRSRRQVTGDGGQELALQFNRLLVEYRFAKGQRLRNSIRKDVRVGLCLRVILSLRSVYAEPPVLCSGEPQAVGLSLYESDPHRLLNRRQVEASVWQHSWGNLIRPTVQVYLQDEVIKKPLNACRRSIQQLCCALGVLRGNCSAGFAPNKPGDDFRLGAYCENNLRPVLARCGG